MARTPASCVWPSLALVLTVACRDRDTQDVRRAGTFASEPVGWRAYAGDAETRRYSPVADISPGNVAALEPAWSWETGEVEREAEDTGERLWRWEPIPQQAGAARDSWENGSASRTGHGNVWAPFSVDAAAGLVYLPVSAASNDYYGGHRLGDNLHTQSLVCLDAATGVQRWARQRVHHDIWDYDPASPPALVSITVQGRRIDAVVLAGKTGFLYVFDRYTGEPVWPMAEQPVPASDVPGERAAATQPFPAWPRPFARHGAHPVLHEGRLLLAGGGVTAGYSATSSVEVLWSR
jgi:glucose dehydrogenase